MTDAEVAPYVGAWIETTHERRIIKSLSVAPYVGAWIETCRGLNRLQKAKQVAPYVGAWIETLVMPNFATAALSHPMWVRGLKLNCL